MSELVEIKFGQKKGYKFEPTYATFGEGVDALILDRTFEINEHGIPGWWMVIQPLPKLFRRYGLDPNKDVDRNGTLKRWYPAKYFVELDKDTAVMLCSFSGEETPLTRVYGLVIKENSELHKDNHFLKIRIGNLAREKHFLSHSHAEYWRNTADTVTDLMRVRGRVDEIPRKGGSYSREVVTTSSGEEAQYT